MKQQTEYQEEEVQELPENKIFYRILLLAVTVAMGIVTIVTIKQS